jgi:hypothetical protein
MSFTNSQRRPSEWTTHGLMDKRRRQQAEGCGTNALGQELGCSCRDGPGSNEKSVLEQMGSYLGSQQQRSVGGSGTWTEGEDKLQDVDWVAGSALVPGRTKIP